MKVRKIKLLACLNQQNLLSLASITIRNKKWWVRPAWQRRKQEGDYQTLVKSLSEEDPVYFKKYLRLKPEEFKQLKVLVAPFIKKHPAGRKALSVGNRLAITLRFLSSGDSLTSIAFAFRIGISTAHYIVKEVCAGLWTALKPLYLPKPTVSTWTEIENGYSSIWNFPNCIGAVDGKHVIISAPGKSGSLYYNYKGGFSTILMAVVDHEYKFVVVDVGSYGSNSDGGVWKNSTFGRKFDEEKVPLPKDKNPPGFSTDLPYVLVGDEAFQLRKHFMRPFPGSQLNDDRRIFNYRLSRARRCSENAFGILSARWRILRKPIILKPENVDLAVRACIVLHNFLMVEKQKSDSYYCPVGFADLIGSSGEIIDGEWRKQSDGIPGLASTYSRNFSFDAESVRNHFVEYFVNAGAVPWQRQKTGL